MSGQHNLLAIFWFLNDLLLTQKLVINFRFYILFIAEKAPSEATFRGTEFLSYDLGQTGGEPIVSTQDAISLYFRTRQPNGLLFYTGKSNILLKVLKFALAELFHTLNRICCPNYPKSPSQTRFR